MKAKILVVEDQKIIALEITQRLEEIGYEVVGNATNGNAAIQMATNLAPDLILMDIKLEGNMDGVEAADRIKSLIGCPIIFLTAYADDKTINRAKITEPFGYIVKPLEEKELHSSIEIALYKSKIEKGLKDSEARYRAIIKSLEVFLYIVDENYNILVNNRHVNGLNWGEYKSEKKCYEEFYRNRVPCKNCPIPEMQKGITIRTEIFDNNSTRYFYRVSTPLVLSNNRNYYQHFLIDITEKKKSEEEVVVFLHEKDMLMNEFNQRVRKNLQFIQSLVRIKGINTNEEKTKLSLNEIESKIQCITLALEELNSFDEKGKINFKDYAEKLLLNINWTYGNDKKNIVIKNEIEDISLPIDIAIPAGILINELVLKSFNDSYPGSDRGEINIRLSEGNGMLKLTVKDDGKLIYDNYSDTKRIDLQIIKTLCEQLRATASVKYDNGNEFTAEF
jgi:two-component sensor histidine kinase/AmiR/NasT family two-component response regulator